MNDEAETSEQAVKHNIEAYPFRIASFALILGGMWSLMVLASLMWNIHQTKQGILDLAHSQARVAYEKDVIYRRWNASHGGVYVPATDKSPPNPYLEVREKDITTPSGVALTLMNPAYMTRQVHELAAEEYGVQGHITSLHPIRPANAPDPWETTALKAFQKGAKEVSSLELMKGQTYLRLMRPLFTEKGCLKCHEAQGYKMGDIHGGISVSLPMSPLLAVERSQTRTLFFAHVFLWLCGLVGLAFATRRIGQHMEKRKIAEEALQENAELLKATLESTADGILAVNDSGGVISSNTRFLEMWRIPDSLLAEKDDEQLLAHVLNQLEAPDVFLARVQELYTSSKEDFDTLSFIDGRIFERFSCPLVREGRIAGRVWSFRDVTGQKRAEQSLRKSEARFRSLVETTSDWVWEIDTDYVYTYASPKVLELLGYESSEIVGKTPFDLMPPGEAERMASYIQPYIEKAKSFAGLENLNFHKDGHPVVLETSAVPVFDEHGTLSGYRGIDRDITERKRAEEELRESELFQRTLLDNLNAGVVIVDAETHVIERANPAAAALFGAPVDQIEGRRCHQFLCPAQEGSCPVLDLGLEIDNSDREILRGDGTRMPILKTVKRIHLGGKGKLLEFFLDITERKRVEDALRESQERFQELAELLPETIFEMDTGGNLTFVNQNAFAHFGYSHEDFDRGFYAFDLLSPEDRPRALQNAKRVMSGEKLGLNEYQALRKDGSTFTALLNSSAKLVDGRPAGVRGIVIDITDTKKLEAQLRQAHKMEAVGTLAGGIAHDFNNLLQAVLGFAELLLLKKKKGEQGYREICEIERAAKRGRELTRQLLTFSRKVEPKLKPLDLNRIVEDVRLILERTIPKLIKIELHLVGNLHVVNADASQIEQVLMNLALNARDAMPDGGTVSIETRNVLVDDEYRRSLPELVRGQYVLLAVTDTGQGMDKSILEHIFDPFFTTKEVGKGTGLGLAMVYGIVKNHGGHITCTSKTGSGTTFEIYLPAVEQHAKTPTNATETKELLGGHETVLLVDDDDSVRELGVLILQRFGYTVMTAPDGVRALQIYRERKNEIDLIILDLIMPVMGGRQCLQKILEINSQAKVVVASGYDDLGQTENVKEFGAKAFIKKPYDIQQMLHVVRGMLG